MSKSLDPAAYPAAFHQILSDMANGKELRFQVRDRKQATYVRFRFYDFRQALQHEIKTADYDATNLIRQYEISKGYELTIKELDEGYWNARETGRKHWYLIFRPRGQSDLHETMNALYEKAEIVDAADLASVKEAIASGEVKDITNTSNTSNTSNTKEKE